MITPSNSISTFKSAFQGGTRANRFLVSGTWPIGIGANSPNTQMQYKIVSTGIPTATIGTITVGYRGRPIVFAGDRQYPVWNVTVYDDSNTDSNLWKIFQNWIDAIDGHVDHKYVNDDFSYKNHQTTMTLQQLGLNGNTIRTITLYKAWPVSVYQIELNMQEANPVSFGVQFMFDHMSYTDSSSLSQNSDGT